MPLIEDENGVPVSRKYWDLPEGERAELVDGVLYAMTSPSRAHQDIVAGLTYEYMNYVRCHGGPCRVYPAPFSVVLRADESTILEPDMVVVCDPSKLSDRGCEGAPDLVVEVVSPSTRSWDYIRKLGRYEAAGVREYWIVDPLAGHTTVYRFDTGDATPRTYGFDEDVPVGIWGGDCSVVIANLP